MVLRAGDGFAVAVRRPVPANRRPAPRPGRWMNTLKMALGVMMLASSFWLATLLGVHLGETASGVMALALTVAALIALLVAHQRTTPALWLVVIVLAAYGGFQVRRSAGAGFHRLVAAG